MGFGATSWVATLAAHERPLAICADPDNLPFSNQDSQGFEDKIAVVVASELGARIDWIWRSSRRGFVRRSLGTGACDLVMELPPGAAGALPTRPYYRSSYMVVSRAERPVRPVSWDDPALRRLRIGLQAVGAEGANTPPAEALARRGVNQHISGFPVFSADGDPDGQGQIVEAVANGQIDAAFVWGPVAGYYARAHKDLTLAVAPADPATPDLAFAYDVAIGVRPDEPTLRDAVDVALVSRRADIERILDDYGVPRGTTP